MIMTKIGEVIKLMKTDGRLDYVGEVYEDICGLYKVKLINRTIK